MAKSLLETFEKLDASTKHALADISKPRLLAFAVLEIAESRCGVDWLSAEHIVACLETAGVAVKKLSISRALAGAVGYISSRNDGGEILFKLMTKGKREIETLLSKGKISVVRIEKNQPRTARLEIKGIFKGLNGVVRICDPYYGVRTFDLLDHVPANVNVRFLTSRTNEAGRKLQGVMRDFKRERPNVRFKQASKNAGLHDRFIVTSTFLLIVGHGLKDIGGKESFLIWLDKELVPDLIRETTKAFDLKWKDGKDL